MSEVRLVTVSEGENDPGFCGACQYVIGNVEMDGLVVFVPYVLLPDEDDEGALTGFDLACAVRHCGVKLTAEVADG